MIICIYISSISQSFNKNSLFDDKLQKYEPACFIQAYHENYFELILYLHAVLHEILLK